jgi:general secretion pathway protein D
VSLLFSAPAQTAVGQEFVVSLGLPAGNEGANATMELSYDPAVLNIVWGEAAKPPTPGTPSTDPGRALVDVVAPAIAGTPLAPTTVRFRVVATAPTTTQIRIENLTATDGAGRQIAINAPAGHNVAIVGAQGSK